MRTSNCASFFFAPIKWEGRCCRRIVSPLPKGCGATCLEIIKRVVLPIFMLLALIPALLMAGLGSLISCFCCCCTEKTQTTYFSQIDSDSEGSSQSGKKGVQVYPSFSRGDSFINRRRESFATQVKCFSESDLFKFRCNAPKTWLQLQRLLDLCPQAVKQGVTLPIGRSRQESTQIGKLLEVCRNAILAYVDAEESENEEESQDLDWLSISRAGSMVAVTIDLHQNLRRTDPLTQEAGFVYKAILDDGKEYKVIVSSKQFAVLLSGFIFSTDPMHAYFACFQGSTIGSSRLSPAHRIELAHVPNAQFGNSYPSILRQSTWTQSQLIKESPDNVREGVAHASNDGNSGQRKQKSSIIRRKFL